MERIRWHPDQSGFPEANNKAVHVALHRLCQQWAASVEWNSTRTDTHDLGFLIQPAFRRQWELFGDETSLSTLRTAASTLASRYSAELSAIRSWDKTTNKRFSYSRSTDDFLVIIDSLCNLDLLFFIGHQCEEQSLIDIAVAHARTVGEHHVREGYSTFHLVNFDPHTSNVKAKATVQGYSDTSTWARGQAWAILGFAQTYAWTRDRHFLSLAKGCADLLLEKIVACKSQHSHPYVLPWDFEAPPPTPGEPIRDSSAAMAAAVGLLHLHACLIGTPLAGQASQCPREDQYDSRYLDMAIKIAEDTLDLCLDTDLAAFNTQLPTGFRCESALLDENNKFLIKESGFDAILRHATAQNSPQAFQQIADHGSVYADYFLLEFGNLLLRLETRTSTSTA